MKILVTGATGFIGAAIARKLSQQRHEILALSRSDSAAAKLRSAGLIPVFGDFADPVSLAAPAAQVAAIVSTDSIGQVEGTLVFYKAVDGPFEQSPTLRQQRHEFAHLMEPMVLRRKRAVEAVCSRGRENLAIAS